MATCSDIIARALRMAKVIGIGDTPTASEEDEGMIVLQSIYQRLADTALATDTPRIVQEDTEAEEGERLYADGAYSITLPETVIDLDTGEERRPKDLAAIAYQDETTAGAWEIYISDHGDWVQVNDLSESDDAPLSDRNREGLSALVAMDLAGTFGKEIGADIIQKARRFQSQMQPKNDDPVEYY